MSHHPAFAPPGNRVCGSFGNTDPRRVRWQNRKQRILLEFAKQQLAVMVTPRLMQLRCLAIGEARRFPELGELLHRMGPARSIDRLEHAFRYYTDNGELNAPDLSEAASNFNWPIMGGPSTMP